MFGPGLLRLLLALSVVLSHTTPGRFGVVAVMVFFILSGYWVSRMYDENYSRGPSPLAVFWLSRFLRLWPAFAVAVILAMALRALRGDVVNAQQLGVLSMLGVASGIRDPLGISWSLDIEMQFYIVLPLLLLAAARASAASITLGVAALSVVGWVLAVGVGVSTVLQYLPAFAAGIGIWRLRDSLASYVTARSAAVSVALFIAVGAILLMSEQTRGVVIETPMNRRLIHLGSLAWSLSLIPFVAWTIQRKGVGFDRVLGDFSYSLYLVHLPLIETLEVLWTPDRTPMIVAAKVLICVAVAAVFFWIVDRPFERFRRAATRPGRIDPTAGQTG